MTREILLFLIVFAAGMMILTFAGIIWMTAIWKKLALTMRQKAVTMRENGIQIKDALSNRTLSRVK